MTTPAQTQSTVQSTGLGEYHEVRRGDPGWFDPMRDELVVKLQCDDKVTTVYRKANGTWWQSDGSGNVRQLKVEWEAAWIEDAARHATQEYVTDRIEHLLDSQE